MSSGFRDLGLQGFLKSLNPKTLNPTPVKGLGVLGLGF